MKTKFRSRTNLLRLGFLLVVALSVQPLSATEPTPLTPADVLQLETAVEKAIQVRPDSRLSGLFTNIRQNSKSGDQVITGRTYSLRAGESADGDVVVIRGHARIDGIVNGDLCLIASDAEISGTINGDMVAVASKTHFKEGAVVNGDFSSVIFTVAPAPDVHVKGSHVNVDFLPRGAALNLGPWITGPILLLRPLSP